MNQAKYIERQFVVEDSKEFENSGVSSLVARLLSARGVKDPEDLDMGMNKLLRPSDLKGAKEAGELLANAIVRGERLTIVADYDCDGACACAVMVRGLHMLGAKPGTVNYLVPDRQLDGYGLTPVIVDRAIEQQAPNILVTVDNGIASFDGVRRALDKGLKVLVTDHHLPAMLDGRAQLPDATVIVNPSQPGCTFPSKALCGAGVAFYTMLMVRSALRECGVFDAKSQPRLDCLLDLVALATVADVVKMDANNRRLVFHGISRMRARACIEGVRALFGVSGRNQSLATGSDLGFTLGPRINAAGRMSDMRIGIECLLTDDPERATVLATMLHQINQERRGVEAGMADQAESMVSQLHSVGDDAVIVVYDEFFHEGVVGIVAGRVKEREHRPTFVFAKSHTGELKGSGRSIEGFHIRDALDLVSKRRPGLIFRFGGHAMAAGCTIRPDGVVEFRDALSQVAREWLTADLLEKRIATDGGLNVNEFTVVNVKDMSNQVWGQGFEAPLFVDKASILQQKLVGGKHLKLTVSVDGQRRDGIWFGRADALPMEATLAYKVSINVWNGRETVQMLVEDILEFSPVTG